MSIYTFCWCKSYWLQCLPFLFKTSSVLLTAYIFKFVRVRLNTFSWSHIFSRKCLYRLWYFWVYYCFFWLCVFSISILLLVPIILLCWMDCLPFFSFFMLPQCSFVLVCLLSYYLTEQLTRFIHIFSCPLHRAWPFRSPSPVGWHWVFLTLFVIALVAHLFIC